MKNIFEQWKENRNWAVVDTETSGLTARDQVIEVSVVHADGRILFDQLVKPTCDINPHAERIHGISKEMLKNQPHWIDLHKEFESSLNEIDFLLAYNESFDKRMIRQTYLSSEITIPSIKMHCIMQSFRDLINEEYNISISSKKLIDLIIEQGYIPHQKQHRALDDALLARQFILGFDLKQVKIS